jgi:hypothetical protein
LGEDPDDYLFYWNVHDNEIIDFDGQMEINIRTTTNDNAKTTTASILFPITED